ncbi:ABC transporter ATP-binding protein [Clostridium aminobutyricum]|uniref:ABC transporter ATP-binding protein n=1 Tax=Clostridium aminobutyricum TaxID=33953 RepID=A0A939D861_CLOAM|nr:ABC transporter ATP-binding protein [Clostridium aminobutyricum]MBN7773194.1 ABC transporter ATP-binding protein [Clostridium aminobutyricum]
MEYSIIVNNITKRYNEFALEEVSLKLPKGSIMGLIGENGAGKTTLIKLILGLQKGESGEISLWGYDSNTLPNHVRENIGVVLDESCFPENLNAHQISKVMKSIYGNWDENNFKKYAEYFDLSPKKAVKQYSKGMKMKLSIAVALSHHAKLLILDEATSGLDPVVREELLDVFLDFIQDEENSILISSHITSDLEKACDYISVINDGKIILSDVKDDILDRYGMLKCSEEEFQAIPKDVVVGFKRSSFGMCALVDRNKLAGRNAGHRYVIDKVSLEDVLLYSVRG